MDTLPGDKKDTKVLQSTISRFACRILVDRNDPYRARIYAAGFDSSRNIFLGVSIFDNIIFCSCVLYVIWNNKILFVLFKKNK